MGGINHSPTSSSSLAVAVEASHDISQLIIKLHAGNMCIEEAILAIRGGSPRFGIAKLKLREAAGFFSPTTADIVVQRVKDVLALVDRDDYQPFRLADPESEIEQLITAGLVVDCAASRKAAADMVGSNYLETFDYALELSLQATKVFEELHAETARLAGDPGTTEQGYFWMNVETGKTPWRALFAAALVGSNELLNYWAASAMLSSQAHYGAMNAPDLLAQLEAHAVFID